MNLNYLADPDGVAARGGFCFVFALHASLLAAGCGDPLFASFGVRQDDDSSKQRDAARADARDEPDDAPGQDAEPKAGLDDGSVAPWNGLTPMGCFVLPDLSIVSNVDSGVIVAREAVSQGCAAPDGGGGTSAGTTYTRRDGEPIVEAGQRYSFRWGADTILTRVRLLGGAETCSLDTMVSSDPNMGLTPALVLSKCSEFTAPQTAPHLRLYGYGHDFYSFAVLSLNVVFALCPGSCPANTQVTIDDAGVLGLGAPDAGSSSVPSK